MTEPGTVADLLPEVPAVLGELATEFLRRLRESYTTIPSSQESACLMLALRSTSLLVGMLPLLRPDTWDSLEVLMRSFMESRDLLSTFRFNHKGTQQKISNWFAGKYDQSWKPEHKKVEEYLDKLSGNKSELERRWSMFSALSHPTLYAASNSVHVVNYRQAPLRDARRIEQRAADYLSSIATIIISGTVDLPGWVPLSIGSDRIPAVDPFLERVTRIALPITQATRNMELPPDSFRG